jgi:hypothetical protein
MDSSMTRNRASYYLTLLYTPLTICARPLIISKIRCIASYSHCSNSDVSCITCILVQSNGDENSSMQWQTERETRHM